MADERFGLTRKTERTDATDPRVEHVVQRLESLSGRSLKVRFHRNRWTYFNCRPIEHRQRLRVGLHESFLDAAPTVIRAVATLIRRRDRRASAVVRSFIKSQIPLWEKRADRPARPPRLVARGEVYDLNALFNEINRQYFEGRCSAAITWGNGQRSARGQRQITFGTYDKTVEVIRIHPALDHRRVPEYFVRYIVFHEILHATLPPPVSPSGRLLFHSRLFRQRERMFEDFERAQAYQKHFVEDVI